MTLWLCNSCLLWSFNKKKNCVILYICPTFFVFNLCFFQSLEHRLHSTSHSLQATPNSTIHSLGPPTHPRLADLWAAAQVEPHQMEIMGHMSITLAETGTPESYSEELVTENECIPEQQEEEEAKVCSLQFCNIKK